MQLLRETYTYKSESVITNVTTTEIEKPSIYYSVNKINKYLKKEVKKGGISEDEAKDILMKALIVTLNIRHQNTEKLEKELWSLKDPKEITNLYTKRISLVGI